MRRLLAPVVLAACAAPSFAQTAPYLGEVTADAVVLRAGPSDLLPETGQLFRGTRVVVDHEEANGWLAVEPPKGQVSWVNHKFLEPPTDALPRNVVVNAEPDAEVAAGRIGHPVPLDVRKARVPNGTIVVVVGKKVEHNGSWWYPVEPPAGDFRYLPRSAVTRSAGRVPDVVVRAGPVESGKPAESKPFDPVPAAVPAKPPATLGVPGKAADWPNNYPLWRQADDADRAGDYPRAEELYLRLAGDMNQPGGDADLANLCYTRVHAVREKQRGGKPAPRPGTGSDLPPPPAQPSGEWVGPGSLRASGLKVDGKPTFALVGGKGELKCYAVAGPGVDLDRYRGSEVELYGEVARPSDLRGYQLVTVTRIQLDRGK